MSYKDGGYYSKFDIKYSDTGKSVEGKTFTLFPERDSHAKTAVLAYADSVQSENAELASDLRNNFGD